MEEVNLLAMQGAQKALKLDKLGCSYDNLSLS